MHKQRETDSNVQRPAGIRSVDRRTCESNSSFTILSRLPVPVKVIRASIIHIVDTLTEIETRIGE